MKGISLMNNYNANFRSGTNSDKCASDYRGESVEQAKEVDAFTSLVRNTQSVFGNKDNTAFVLFETISNKSSGYQHMLMRPFSFN